MGRKRHLVETVIAKIWNFFPTVMCSATGASNGEYARQRVYYDDMVDKISPKHTIPDIYSFWSKLSVYQKCPDY